jgi:hypothetical protein
MTRQLSVFFFAATALVCETLLFHVTKYVLDYLVATAVISCAVAGIGVGAFLASRLVTTESRAFGWCCGGTTFCLYAAAWVLLRWPCLYLLLPAVASVFVFPSYYIARAFAQGSPRSVYLSDMLGAGTAVLLIVLAYEWMQSETIFLVLVTAIPVAGVLSGTWRPAGSWLERLGVVGLLLGLVLLGATLWHQQATHNTFLIPELIPDNSPFLSPQSILARNSRHRIERTYDNLISRLDVSLGQDRTFVTYDGYFNDNFAPFKSHDYAEYAGPQKVDFPSVDPRVVYGLVREPRVFVIGPASTGIIKTLRTITPIQNIQAVEINPGVLQMMRQDYFRQSGEAYRDLPVVLGNALSVLRRDTRKFDLITLINAHSTRWIGALGPPDHLHTQEAYDLYFDHLTEDGYLLFEERPDTLRGELGVKRMLLTLYDCLRRRGVRDPAEHFFIWEWMSRRHLEQGRSDIVPGSDMYYVGIVVSLKPFVGQRRDDLLAWCNLDWCVDWTDKKHPVFIPYQRQSKPAYLQGQWHSERFGPFFEMLASGDFSQLADDFDSSLVTNNRPFPSCSTHAVPEIRRLLSLVTGICVLTGGLFAAGAIRRISHPRQAAALVVYNLAIGAAYFFVEILLMQAYQGVFLSPTVSLAVVLGTLLIGSAAGGLLAGRVPPWLATIALIPVLAVAFQIPHWSLNWDLGERGVSLVSAISILVVGANMGVFFPSGLLQAYAWSLREKVPHLFAVNALAGSLATVVSLYLAIRVGYTWTLVAAVCLYLAASLVYHWALRCRVE